MIIPKENEHCEAIIQRMKSIYAVALKGRKHYKNDIFTAVYYVDDNDVVWVKKLHLARIKCTLRTDGEAVGVQKFDGGIIDVPTERIIDELDAAIGSLAVSEAV